MKAFIRLNFVNRISVKQIAKPQVTIKHIANEFLQ